jgi:hypothetical protein
MIPLYSILCKSMKYFESANFIVNYFTMVRQKGVTVQRRIGSTAQRGAVKGRTQ